VASHDGRDPLVELEELCTRMTEVEDECAAKAVELSQLVMDISDALIDLGVFPIRDIPLCPKSAQDVLAVVDPILECLREEHASVADPWA
jgi:hypothetical protein